MRMKSILSCKLKKPWTDLYQVRVFNMMLSVPMMWRRWFIQVAPLAALKLLCLLMLISFIRSFFCTNSVLATILQLLWLCWIGTVFKFTQGIDSRSTYAWTDSALGVRCATRTWWPLSELTATMAHVWAFCWIFRTLSWCYSSVHKCEIFESIVLSWIILILEFSAPLNSRYEDQFVIFSLMIF